MTDEEILALIQKKEDIGLSMLAVKYEKLLVYIAAGILGSYPRDIEECVNDTYLKFWRHAEKFDIQKASLPTYLKVIIRNTAINRLRDLKRHEDKTYSDDISDLALVYTDQAQNIENQIVRRESVEQLNQMLRKLPERDRELMLRKYFYLQPSKVIGKAMNMTVTAVDSRLSRLRSRMKEDFSIWDSEGRGSHHAGSGTG